MQECRKIIGAMKEGVAYVNESRRVEQVLRNITLLDEIPVK
jgi:hypothetical protein